MLSKSTVAFWEIKSTVELWEIKSMVELWEIKSTVELWEIKSTVELWEINFCCHHPTTACSDLPQFFFQSLWSLFGKSTSAVTIQVYGRTLGNQLLLSPSHHCMFRFASVFFQSLWSFFGKSSLRSFFGKSTSAVTIPPLHVQICLSFFQSLWSLFGKSSLRSFFGKSTRLPILQKKSFKNRRSNRGSGTQVVRTQTTELQTQIEIVENVLFIYVSLNACNCLQFF
jgi:hypothetical protein